MSIFEIQIVSEGRWKAIDAFEDYGDAYESAEWIERKQLPKQLRICQLETTRSGATREKTIYEGGQKVRSERAAAQKRRDQEAFMDRIAARRENRVMAEAAASQRKKLFSSNSPVYLTLVTLTIGLTGLSAMYLVEKAFMY